MRRGTALKAIVLGAGRGVDLEPGGATPKCLLEGLAGWRALDWVLNALREGAGVTDFVLVGGDAIERIRQAYPTLRIVENPRWAQQHVLGSLFCAKQELDGPLILSYGDIVYRPAVAAALRAAAGDIVLAVDTTWRRRNERRGQDRLRNAEKVLVRGGRVARIGKDLPVDGEITGEFIGLARLSADGAAAVRSAYDALRSVYRDRPYRKASNLDNACLSDLLQELIEQGSRIDLVEIGGDWAEVDAPGDLARFVFGTKGETLQRLRPLLQEARVGDGMVVRVGQWQADPAGVTRALTERFGEGALAVRSSALREDAAQASHAGHYRTVLGVAADDADAIRDAVETVVASLDRDGGGEADQILVQPCLQDVVMGGVMMTRDLDTGADYTVVHYDEGSGRTDAVTSGVAAVTRTVLVYRGAVRPRVDARVGCLLRAAGELESITGSDALDVEFAFTADGTLHVLQVRPIAASARWAPVDRQAHGAELAAVRDLVRRRMRPRPGLLGGSTVFGQMPDWNPAEVIGAFPAPLARSLYEALITDRAWRVARTALGYRDAVGHRLMVTLADRPYVDVRCSANTLLPAGLDPACGTRVIDAGLALLRARPQLHDKIEFEVFPTCLDAGYGASAVRLREHGLLESDVAPLRAALRTLTADLLHSWRERVAALLAAVERLAPRCDDLLRHARDPLDHPMALATLLESTVRDGTIPFAALARYAFIATALLRSLRDRGALPAQQLDLYLGGIHTVSAQLLDDLDALRAGRVERGAFLARYGHLRPGSYDILSPRYDQAFDTYFPGLEVPSQGDGSPSSASPGDAPTAHAGGAADGRASSAARLGQDALALPARTLAEIDRVLAELELDVPATELLDFARASLGAREHAKFAFTRNLSWALELIAQWGERLGFSREDVALLEVDDILAVAQRSAPAHGADHLARRIADARLHRAVTSRVLLPPLITGEDDLEVVVLPAGRPNFVTGERVQAAAVALDPHGGDPGLDLRGKIAVIEGADPGYDWIFGRGIAGLVTCYGGANSHMTVRCAELGLPAAIGCGEAHYARLVRARGIELDCGAEVVRAL